MSGADLSGLLDAYRLLSRQLNLPPLNNVRLVCTQRLVSEAELEEAMGDYDCGWVARQSGVAWFGSQYAPGTDDKALGRVLQAELATDDRSLHVAFDSMEQGWRLVCLAESDHSGEHYLMEELSLLLETAQEQTGRSDPVLRYRRYWGQAEPGGAMQPLHARFCGFAEGD